MDANAGGSHGIRHASNGSSSAVNFSGTGVGVVVRAPSPALGLSDTDDQHTRRRLSWSNADGRPGPSHLNVPATQVPEPWQSALAVLEEDSFVSTMDRPLRNSSSLPSTCHLDASSASLLSTLDLDADTTTDDGTRFTDQAQLKPDAYWSTVDLSVDSERSAGFTSRPKRQYTSSPLKRTITNAFHRASMRIANVRGDRPYVGLREDDEGSDSSSTLEGAEETTRPGVGERVAHRTAPSMPLRGRALGILGPTNPLRLWLYKLLIHPYVCRV